MSSPPEYALLLNGAWGSGKTWFIKRFQEANTQHKYLYVSLYGVSSILEIEDQFFQQLHPLLASRPFTIGAKVLKGLLKTTISLDLNGDKSKDVQGTLDPSAIGIEKFLKSAENRVLIFDDLERCRLKPEEILGYINAFVEHQKQKVIILGFEKEIPGLEEYRKKSEKLIGRTFTIQADIDNALDVFLKDESIQPVLEVLKSNIGVIHGIYDKAEYKNLRTLKYSILEYNRFFSQLPQTAKSHLAFQTACIRTFFALCIELRSDRMTVDQIKDLTQSYQDYLVQKALKKDKKDAEPSLLAAIYEKHFELFDGGIFPSEECLYLFFKFGLVPEKVVESAVLNSKYFIDERTASWVRLWHLHCLTEADFQKYYREVWKDFKDLKFTIEGEFRHVVAILLNLSEK